MKTKKDSKKKTKKKEMSGKERKQVVHGMKLRMIRRKEDYTENLVNGRYWLARCDMIADQLNKHKILENLDGCPKSRTFMFAEYAVFKKRAIRLLRNAHFAEKDLMKEFKLTKEDIIALEKTIYEGKIVRKEYDESYKKRKKAEFVKTPPKH